MTITVHAVNDAPVAQSISETPMKIPHYSDAVATDVDSSSFIYTIADPSDLLGKGSLSDVNGNQVTFTPNEDWNGTASFSYKANDGDLNSEPATVTITVNAVNDAPVAQSISENTDEDTPITLTLSASDVDSSSFTYTIADPSNLSGKGSLSVINGDQVTFTPNENWNGTVSFTYKANDGELDSESVSVTIAVSAVNDAPVAQAITESTNEDTPITLTLSATDVDSSSFTYTIADTSGLTDKGSLSVIIGNQVTFTPNGDWNGTANFTYKANDGDLDSEPVTVTITVNTVNDAPVAVDDMIDTNEDTSAEYDVVANDTDIDNNNTELAVINVTQPEHATVSIGADGRTLSVVPSGNWNGSETFSYTVEDTGGLTSVAAVTLNVASVNDAPVAVNDSKSTNEDTQTTIDVLANDTDVDLTTNPSDESLTVSAVTDPSHGTAVISNNKILYTPSLIITDRMRLRTRCQMRSAELLLQR